VSHRLGPCSVEGVASAIRSGDNDRIEQLVGMLAFGLAAVDPERTVAEALAREPNRVGHVAVVAVGKSAAAIAREAARTLNVLAEWLSVITSRICPMATS
jgi:glycerate-2-kinase